MGRASSRKRAPKRAGHPRRSGGTQDKLLASIAPILRSGDPLAVEQVASGLLGGIQMVSRELPEHLTAGNLLGRQLLAAAEKKDAEAVALLFALGALDPHQFFESMERAGAIASQWEDYVLPAWRSKVGHAMLVGCWLGGDPFGDQQVLFLGFRHEGSEPHTLSLLLDRNMSGIIKDATLLPTPNEVIPRTRKRAGDEMTIVEVDPAKAARVFTDAFETNEVNWLEPPWEKGYQELRAIIRSRLADMPKPAPASKPSSMTKKERAALVRDFLASDHAPSRDQTPDAKYLVEGLIEYKLDYLGEEALRWSPIAVEMCLCDWYPRKVHLDPGQIDQVPRVLKGWVRFALERRGLAGPWIDETLAAAERFESDYRKAMCESSRFGAAKSIAAQMVADGVDLTNQSEVQAWVSKFNSGLGTQR